MQPRPHRIRRARRTDFVRIMELLATSRIPVPPADRSTLRRFRRIVADLGADLYVAVIDERVVGVVHVTYARQLITGAHARIEVLVVAPDVRRRGIAAALAALIAARARRRGCSELTCASLSVAPEAAAFFTAMGWRCRAGLYSRDLDEACAGKQP
jgi:N-acetylglutamate synthase-like GNAT family acetyltransferase